MKIVGLISYILFWAISVIGQKSQDGITTRDILQNMVDARGGKAYLSSIKTFYAEMLVESGGDSFKWITKEMVPNKGALTVLKNDSVVRDSWFNGTAEFEIVDGQKREIQAMYTSRQMLRKNIFTELDYLDSTLWVMERKNDEFIDSRPCFKLKGTFITGESRYLYIEKTTFCVVKQEDIDSESGKVYFTSYFSDFKKFGDFYFYSSTYSVADNHLNRIRVVKVLINESVSEDDFNK